MKRDSALSKRQKQLFLIFKRAIEAERSAQVMYTEAQRFCDDPTLKEVLQGIVKEEAGHEKALLRWYARLKEGLSGEETPS